MHIAICDDNIADRKQLERLLGRESDKRKASTGVFYVDSFGDCEALAKNPMPYDLFFIDITTGKTDGLDFACELKSAGVTAPIILCSSQIDYRTKTDLLPKTTYEFMHLSKPIITTELSSVAKANSGVLKTLKFKNGCSKRFWRHIKIVIRMTPIKMVPQTMASVQPLSPTDEKPYKTLPKPTVEISSESQSKVGSVVLITFCINKKLAKITMATIGMS